MVPLTTVVVTVPFVDEVWIATRWFEGFLSARRVGITYTSASTVPFLDSIFRFRLVAVVSLGSKGGKNAVGIRSAGSIIHDPFDPRIGLRHADEVGWLDIWRCGRVLWYSRAFRICFVEVELRIARWWVLSQVSTINDGNVYSEDVQRLPRRAIHFACSCSWFVGRLIIWYYDHGSVLSDERKRRKSNDEWRGVVL